MSRSAPLDELAISGGPKAFPGSWPAWPAFDEEQIAAATNVLRTGRVNYWTGQEGRLFEQEFAKYVGARRAVAVANGTVALELALYALGIGLGDEVIVPCRTFLATASAAVMRGATPVFADVDEESQNITADTIRPLIGEKTKAVIAVHLAGWPCDMAPILALAKEHGLKVIEDCAQAHGASYRGRPVGSWSDIAAFSFCQDKIMTTGGEGGMVVTSDEELWRRAWSFKDHGKSYDAVYNRPNTGLFRWLHESPGTNWRLTEMQSAIGRAALAKLDQWVERRRENAAVLDRELAGHPAVRIPKPSEEARHSYYKYYFLLRPETLAAGWTRDRFLLALQAEGVPCGGGSCSEIYLEKAFADAGLAPASRRPVAERLGETSVMLQVHHTLSGEQMRLAGKALKKVLAHATLGQRSQLRAA
jgi:dTDP-4-amino-4,6-dideoxygalactose transaminase